MKRINLQEAFSSIWKILVAYLVFYLSSKLILLNMNHFDSYILFTKNEFIEGPFVLFVLSLPPFALSFAVWRWLRVRLDKNSPRPFVQDVLIMFQVIFSVHAVACFIIAFNFDVGFFIFTSSFYIFLGLLFMCFERRLLKKEKVKDVH